MPHTQVENFMIGLFPRSCGHAGFEQRIKQDPMGAMAALQAGYAEAETSFTTKKYAAILGGYQFAQLATANKAVFDEFTGSDFFRDSHARRSKKILLYSMRFIVGARDAKGSLYERARNYAKALQKFFDAGAPAPVVLDWLEKTGIEFLYRSAVIQTRSQLDEKSDLTGLDNSEPVPPDQTQSASAEPDAEPELQSTLDLARSAFRLRSKRRSELFIVHVSKRILRKVLATDEEKTFFLKLRRKPNGDEFAYFIGIGIAGPSEDRPEAK